MRVAAKRQRDLTASIADIENGDILRAEWQVEDGVNLSGRTVSRT